MVADFIGTMNLFPGRVLGSRQPRGPGRGRRLGAFDLPGTAPAGAEVGIAVRPEKVQLGRTPFGDASDRAPAARSPRSPTSATTATSASRPAPDVRITCYQTHRSRRDPDAIAEGEACWVAWDPADCILLTE